MSKRSILGRCVVFSLCALAVCAWGQAGISEGATFTISTFDHDDDGLASGNGADTYIAESSPGSNFGSVSDFKFRYNPTSQQEVAYARFDLSGLGSNIIKDARLQLYDYRFTEGQLLKNRNINVWALSNEGLDNWLENVITWNSAPGHTSAAPAFDGPDLNGDVMFLGSVISTIDGPWTEELNVAGLVDFLQNDTNNQVTLLMQPADALGSLFYLGSKETTQVARLDPTPIPLGSAAPRLILTIAAPIPEPSSAMLLGLGCLFLARTSRGKLRRCPQQ